MGGRSVCLQCRHFSSGARMFIECFACESVMLFPVSRGLSFLLRRERPLLSFRNSKREEKIGRVKRRGVGGVEREEKTPARKHCENEKHPLNDRPQNRRFFFSKSVKKSVKRGVRVLRAQSARRACEAREKKPSLLASLPSLTLCLQPRPRPFVWLLTRTWIRKNTDCFTADWFCSLPNWSLQKIP